jgi:ribonuclease Z
MRVIMLGTGAALVDPDRNHSSILITVRERNYLFDCGHGATHQLMRAGIDPVDIDVIFLSHLHFDHIADFPYFMLSTWIFGRQAVPLVIGPPATQNFVRHLFADGAFAKDIEARAQYPQRQQNLHVLRPDIRECKPGLVHEDDLVKVSACYVEHIPREISPCFGLRMDTVDGQSVVFSGDTSPCDRLIELARDCDLLIHECTFPQQAIDFRSKAGIGTWAHQPAGPWQDRRCRSCQVAGRHPFRPFRHHQPGPEKTSGQAHAGRPGGAAIHGRRGHRYPPDLQGAVADGARPDADRFVGQARIEPT